MNIIKKHGEVVIRTVKSIPEGAQEVKATKEYKLADSENTGNHHMLQVHDGVKLMEFDDKLYAQLTKDTTVFCRDRARHDDMELKGGHTYEIGIAQEYDHIEQHKRNVLD